MDSFHKREVSLKALKHWFEDQKRDLPWRKNPTPYRVWVSEVMLQQTQAVVVIPYFERWMKRFPTIDSLALAEEEEVIKFWEGLGYYSRARNLRAAARYLAEHHGGVLPNDPEELRKIKGLGPYTIGAIMSFAFHQKAAAVDGNVLRVMSRLLCIEEEVDRLGVKGKIEREVLELLPDETPWIIMEALIELGAQICRRKPTCRFCPIREDCLAFARGKVEELPNKKRRAKAIVLHREVFVVEANGRFLIQRHGENQIMGGLCEFPYVEREEHLPFLSHLERRGQLLPVTHTFTRYKAHLYPILCRAKHPFSEEGFVWVEMKKLAELAFSSGHRKILKQLLEVKNADLTY